jgi:predicted nuclease with TOPRIM domain
MKRQKEEVKARLRKQIEEKARLRKQIEENQHTLRKKIN